MFGLRKRVKELEYEVLMLSNWRQDFVERIKRMEEVTRDHNFRLLNATQRTTDLGSALGVTWKPGGKYEPKWVANEEISDG